VDSTDSPLSENTDGHQWSDAGSGSRFVATVVRIMACADFANATETGV